MKKVISWKGSDYAAKAIRQKYTCGGESGYYYLIEFYEGSNQYDRCIGWAKSKAGTYPITLEDVEKLKAEKTTLETVKNKVNYFEHGSERISDRRMITCLILFDDEDDKNEVYASFEIPRTFGGPGYPYPQEALSLTLGRAIELLLEETPCAKITMHGDYQIKVEDNGNVELFRVSVDAKEETENG